MPIRLSASDDGYRMFGVPKAAHPDVGKAVTADLNGVVHANAERVQQTRCHPRIADIQDRRDEPLRLAEFVVVVEAC